MPTGRFVAVVALLGIGTTLAPFLLGYHLGENLESLLAAFEFVAWAVLILAAGAVVAWFVRRRRRAVS
jgi:membrane protein DedA with SNARE-associated domain